MAKPIKTVRTPSGVRYMRGGKFISKASAKRSRAAKKRAAAKKNPAKKRVTRKAATKRNQPRVGVRPPKKRKTTTKRKDPKRVAAGKKAARTRKRKAAARKTTVRRKKTTTKRRKSVAKRKKTRRISAAGRAAMRRGGRKGGKKTAAKRKRTTTKKRTTKRTTKRKTTRRKRAVKTFRARKPGTRKIRKYRVVKGKRRYTVRQTKKNPGKVMKAALMSGLGMWAGLTGMKVINKALEKHVAAKIPGIPASITPIVPSLAGFLVSTIVVPRVTKNKKFVDALQMGATVAMLDAVFNSFIKSKLPVNIQAYLGESFTVYQPVANFQEYVDYDNRLGEYVDDNRYGQHMVTEALAMDEIDYMQRGGAGGVFAKTSLARG